MNFESFDNQPKPKIRKRGNKTPNFTAQVNSLKTKQEKVNKKSSTKFDTNKLSKK